MTNGAAPEREARPLHRVGAMSFGGDGPAAREISCSYDDDGRFAGQWLVSIDIWEHEDLIDYDNPVQWDAQRRATTRSGVGDGTATGAQTGRTDHQAAEHATLFQDTP